MIKQSLWIAGLLLFFQGNKATVPTSITCQGVRYMENGSPLKDGDFNCTRYQGLTARAIAIDVEPSGYAYGENPPCSMNDTSNAYDLARAALSEPLFARSLVDVKAFGAFWNRLSRRAESMGRDFAALAGGAPGKGSRCQFFAVGVPVHASSIRYIDFRAHQSNKYDKTECFESKPTTKDGVNYGLVHTGGFCAIGWSGWQSPVILGDEKNTVVAAVFKNWSADRTRTGQLWVWYASY